MASQYVTNTNLRGNILTARMPTSDAFNKAQSAGIKPGIHNGFGVMFNDVNYPVGNYSTQVLKIKAGRAIVSIANNSQTYASDPLIAIELDEDVTIDLMTDLTTPIISTDATIYYLIVRVDYTASNVNYATGLITNQGDNAPKFEIVEASTDLGRLSNAGLVLAKFSRADMYLEAVEENSLTFGRIHSKDTGVQLPDMAADEAAGLSVAYLRAAINLTHISNLRKRIHIDGLTSPNMTQFNSASMPLNSVTTSVATNAAAIAGWSRPVDWESDSATTIYSTKGVWLDVEEFKLTNCRFTENVQLAFHRTPGHGKLNTIRTTPASFTDEATIRGYTDYGNDKFIFDGEGSVFEGDLVLDLVLDATGEHKDKIYKIELRNLTVHDDLVLNYGQSILGLAGGLQGTIELRNVVVDGTIDVRPWPQIDGVQADTAVTNANYPNYTQVVHFANNAGNVTFSGYTEQPGPDVLQKWRHDVSADSNLLYTKGVIVPTYLHRATSGAGAMSMGGDPWIENAVMGGVILENVKAPISNLLGEAIQNDPTAPADKVRVRYKNCTLMAQHILTDSFKYRNGPFVYNIGDMVISLTNVAAENYKDAVYARDLTVSNDLTVGGDGSVSGKLIIDSQEFTGDHVTDLTQGNNADSLHDHQVSRVSHASIRYGGVGVGISRAFTQNVLMVKELGGAWNQRIESGDEVEVIRQFHTRIPGVDAAVRALLLQFTTTMEDRAAGKTIVMSMQVPIAINTLPSPPTYYSMAMLSDLGFTSGLYEGATPPTAAGMYAGIKRTLSGSSELLDLVLVHNYADRIIRSNEDAVNIRMSYIGDIV